MLAILESGGKRFYGSRVAYSSQRCRGAASDSEQAGGDILGSSGNDLCGPTGWRPGSDGVQW